MKKFQRFFSFVLVLCLVLCSAPFQASAVPADFKGLAISYDAGVSLKLYSGFDDTTVIEPTYTEGNTKYYANLSSGKYRAYLTRSGYITMSENIYISAAEEYKKRSSEFLNFFIHYFDSDGGMAAYGRSIGYRSDKTSKLARCVNITTRNCYIAHFNLA